MQYQIRLESEYEMTWSEFCILLSGLMAKTPLGQIVSIRSEENKDILKNFTPEQHRIRTEWRSKTNPVQSMSEEEKEKSVKQIQEIFAQAFGSN